MCNIYKRIARATVEKLDKKLNTLDYLSSISYKFTQTNCHNTIQIMYQAMILIRTN